MAYPPYDSSGPLGARTILFLHGVAINRKMWQPQMTALSDEYRVMAPDLPGHGRRAGEPFRIDSAVSSVDDLINKEGQAVLLVGLSLGGFVAMEYAARYPDKVGAMILSGCGENTQSLLLWFSSRAMLLLFQVVGIERLKRWEGVALRKMFPPEIVDPILESGLAHEVMGQVYEEILGKDYRQKLSHFPGPVLILNGERDSFTRMGEKSLLTWKSSPTPRTCAIWSSQKPIQKQPVAMRQKSFSSAIHPMSPFVPCLHLRV